jgi:isopenicillin-N epimerase
LEYFAMRISRKDFLRYTGAAITAGSLAGLTGCRETTVNSRPVLDQDGWQRIRAEFQLDPDWIHLAGLLMVSHPRQVREAIEEYRSELDRNPALYLEEKRSDFETDVRRAAADYMGVEPEEIALTDSTTMGIGLVYNGIDVGEGQEILTTEHDYYSTHESIRYKARRTGAGVRYIRLYQDLQSVTEDEIVDSLIREVRPETRVVALTWVHSSTGLKIPVRRIADALAEVNAGRDAGDRALLCLDGVHGLGVENVAVEDLGCDFLMVGTHKWMLAPRGTGLIWGAARAQAAVSPTVPTFTRGDGWGGSMTPGGFKSFEHMWGMRQAFEFHQSIGKSQVTERIHGLNRHFKELVSDMAHVTLHTPLDENLSAGITCFDVEGLTPEETVSRLRDRNIVASETPYTPSHARVTPGLFNFPEEIEETAAAVRDLA